MKIKSLAIIAILSMAVVASAFASLDISPHTKNIKVGTTGHYTIHFVIHLVCKHGYLGLQM